MWSGEKKISIFPCTLICTFYSNDPKHCWKAIDAPYTERAVSSSALVHGSNHITMMSSTIFLRCDSSSEKDVILKMKNWTHNMILKAINGPTMDVGCVYVTYRLPHCLVLNVTNNFQCLLGCMLYTHMQWEQFNSLFSHIRCEHAYRWRPNCTLCTERFNFWL